MRSHFRKITTSVVRIMMSGKTGQEATTAVVQYQ